MTAYLLRSIDPALWARVCALAEASGLTVRSVILQLLAAYASGDIVIAARAKKTKWAEADSVDRAERALGVE